MDLVSALFNVIKVATIGVLVLTVLVFVHELGHYWVAKLFGMPREQTTGHWCSRCQMIWYGYLLEVACPVCGNRHG